MREKSVERSLKDMEIADLRNKLPRAPLTPQKESASSSNKKKSWKARAANFMSKTFSRIKPKNFFSRRDSDEVER